MFLVYRLPYSGVEYKVPIKMWIRTHASYDIYVFGYLTYYHIRDEKINRRARKTFSQALVTGSKTTNYSIFKEDFDQQNVMFDKASMLKAPSHANSSSPIPVEK